jgi:hypothetical protein
MRYITLNDRLNNYHKSFTTDGSRIGKFTLPLVRFDNDSVEAYTCGVFDLTVPFHAGVDMAREPYGPPITDAIARGDVADMKALAAEAERHLA